MTCYLVLFYVMCYLLYHEDVHILIQENSTNSPYIQFCFNSNISTWLIGNYFLAFEFILLIFDSHLDWKKCIEIIKFTEVFKINQTSCKQKYYCQCTFHSARKLDKISFLPTYCFNIKTREVLDKLNWPTQRKSNK